MGINRNKLPDAVLRRISPADRRADSLPGPLSETVKAAAVKSDLRREKELQVQIENWCRLNGITAIRSRMDKKTRNNKGTPDFLLAVRGQAVALEAKLPGKESSPDQIKMRAALESNGWFYRIVTSLDYARTAVAEAAEVACDRLGQ